jgi:hypothetical protein
LASAAASASAVVAGSVVGAAFVGSGGVFFFPHAPAVDPLMASNPMNVRFLRI